MPIKKQKKIRSRRKKGLTKRLESGIIFLVPDASGLICGHGGTGRRVRLRGVWFYHPGSSPGDRTRLYKKHLCRLTEVFFSAFLYLKKATNKGQSAWREATEGEKSLSNCSPPPTATPPEKTAGPPAQLRHPTSICTRAADAPPTLPPVPLDSPFWELSGQNQVIRVERRCALCAVPY